MENSNILSVDGGYLVKSVNYKFVASYDEALRLSDDIENAASADIVDEMEAKYWESYERKFDEAMEQGPEYTWDSLRTC